jgi:tetratricopeptide (TPR) repeat protein
VKSIQPPDSHHLSAAQGWIELGRYDEAQEEIRKIKPSDQEHPEVLQVKWLIHAHSKNWKECLAVAEKTIHCVPDAALGWINQANSLFYMKRIEEAYDFLLPVVSRFPENFIIPYNLACYTCQLGRHDEARQWLQTAAGIGEKSAIKSAALRDPDLEPMWNQIHTL